MKKFLSILLSVLVLFNSIFNSGFVLGDDVGNLIENSQESSQTEDQNFTQESNEENTETNSDFLGLITKGGQSGQVLDNGLNSSVDIENIALELEQSLSGGQSVQSGSFGNITNEESGLDNDILPPLTTLGMKGAGDSNIIFDVSFADGKTNLPTGRTAYGLGGDYTNNPKLKFDSSGDWLKSPEFILTTGAIATVRTKANGSSFSGKAIFTDQNDNIVFEFTDFSPNKEKNIIFNVPNTVTQIKLTYEKGIGNLGVGSFKLEYSNDENSGTETSTPKLKITEIYFDGDENWFELTNLGNDTFSGELGLSGNLNFTFSANIPSGVSKVFANSLYSMFQTGKNIQTIVNSINFVNEEFNLDLIRSGQVLDNFFVHSSYVDYYYQDYKTSFEKIGTGDSWTTTVVGLNSDRYYNTNRGIAANPTKYFITGENLIDVTLNKNPYNPDPGNTGNDLNIPIDCNNFYVNWILDISEVYYGSGIYPSYVELNITDDVGDYYPQIKLGGSALDQEIVFSSIELQAGKRFLITDSDTRYNEGRDSLYSSNFSLNGSGWLIVYGKDGADLEVLDVVYLNGGIQGASLYMGTDFIQCAGVFDYVDKFSPGMTIGQSQFIQISPEPVVQYIKVNNGGGFCPQAEGFQFNTNDSINGDIQISSLKYYGNYQILKLKNKTNSDINLRDYKIQGFDGEIKSIKGNTLFAKQTMSFVGNYGFPTKTDHCINLIKDGEIVDRYCRNSMSKASETDEENIQNQLEFWIDIDEEEIDEELEEEVFTGNIASLKNIKIKHIDYDPPGSDKDNETITLLLLTGTQVDLSQYTLQYIKEGKATNKSLKGILTFGAEQTFKGDYTLPNSTQDKNPVIVHILDPNQQIVDTYIYNPNKIKEIPDGEYKVISIIDGDTIKISYLEQEFNIRLAGIDAPESSALRCGKVECFGPEAKEYLNSLLANKTISFQQAEKDDFDRFVGYVFLNGENINEKLVKNGYAREYSYKGKNYKYQSLFQSAQKYAQQNSLGLRDSPCFGKRLCPVEETKILDDYEFTIDYVLYDPEGDDKDKEEITITMHKGFPIQFSEGFYLMVNTTKKSLKNYGGISPNETKTLRGTFGFPNTKATTVSLMYEDTIFATYSYDPEKDKLLEKEENELTGVDIKITGLIPNPKGKDSLGESVRLLYTIDPSVLHSSIDSLSISNENDSDASSILQGYSKNINLADGFYLKIGSAKKKLNGILVPDQEILVTGNFSLPNKAACVEIGYKNIIFDKFCYPHPTEGQKFLVSNGVLESIVDDDFGILKTAKLQNFGNQVCLTYGGQKFYCKNMPYSKLSTKRLNQNKLYKEYFDVFEEYLKSNWRVMYYNSEIKNYFDLLNQIEKAISNGDSTIEFDGNVYSTNEFKAMYESQYPSTVSSSLNKRINELVPSPIVQKYQQL
ncbi:MAG TPA: thermonuclease family protein, partial [Candidatus Absconditabacterales bacterium]|nr:thermonuclease family protein [Candidatus Absconditabacterales bacterium]